MLKLVDTGPAKGTFEGTKGLGRGPENLSLEEFSDLFRASLLQDEAVQMWSRMVDEPRSRSRTDNAGQGDNSRSRTDTPRMNDITREELSATLSAIEDRMDKRIERMEQADQQRSESWRREQDAYRKEQQARDNLYAERFEATSRRLEDRDKVIDSKLDAMNSSVLRMSEKVDGFEKQLDGKLIEVKSSNRNAAWAMLAIAAATVVGIWGVNSTIIGSVTGFFDAGKTSMENQQSIEKLVTDSKLQSEETFKLLQQIQAQQEALMKKNDQSNVGVKGK